MDERLARVDGAASAAGYELVRDVTAAETGLDLDATLGAFTPDLHLHACPGLLLRVFFQGAGLDAETPATARLELVALHANNTRGHVLATLDVRAAGVPLGDAPRSGSNFAGHWLEATHCKTVGGPAQARAARSASHVVAWLPAFDAHAVVVRVTAKAEEVTRVVVLGKMSAHAPAGRQTPVAATGGNLTSGADTAFTFDSDAERVVVTNDTSATTFYVKLDDDEASATNYHVRVEPGVGPVMFSGPLHRLAIHADGGDGTYGSDFTVVGWI